MKSQVPARRLRLVVAPVIVAGCLLTLSLGAVHGVRSTLANSSDAQRAAWEVDARYWSCLETQAHSLVRPGEPVWMDTSNLASEVTLVRIMGGWVDFTGSAKLAWAYVMLRPYTGRGACLGTIVEGLFRGPRGPGTVLRIGSGSSFSGSQREIPVTPS